MQPAKEDIIARLKQEILTLQGSRANMDQFSSDFGLGPVNQAFPNKTFPLAAIHEFISHSTEAATATTAFIAAICKTLLNGGGIAVCISASPAVFPPALAAFGVQPEKVIFITLRNEKEVLWCVEEALRCKGLAAIIGEIKELSFTASRRLQLAVEQSGVTGFIHRKNPRNVQITACLTRWQINSLPAIVENDLPGVGHPCWKVELAKVRNGKPGSWTMGWVNNGFAHIYGNSTIIQEQQRKTG
jgi:protein ImuA